LENYFSKWLIAVAGKISKGGTISMDKKTHGLLIAGALLGLGLAAIPMGCFAAEEANSSSACINCHTDLDEMDSYGAEAAGGGGAIAG
jgi:hypothetical protein